MGGRLWASVGALTGRPGPAGPGQPGQVSGSTAGHPEARWGAGRLCGVGGPRCLCSFPVPQAMRPGRPERRQSLPDEGGGPDLSKFGGTRLRLQSRGGMAAWTEGNGDTGPSSGIVGTPRTGTGASGPRLGRSRWPEQRRATGRRSGRGRGRPVCAAPLLCAQSAPLGACWTRGAPSPASMSPSLVPLLRGPSVPFHP